MADITRLPEYSGASSPELPTDSTIEPHKTTSSEATNSESFSVTGSIPGSGVKATLSLERGTSPEAEIRFAIIDLLSPPTSGRKRNHSLIDDSAGTDEDGTNYDLEEVTPKRRHVKVNELQGPTDSAPNNGGSDARSEEPKHNTTAAITPDEAKEHQHMEVDNIRSPITVNKSRDVEADLQAWGSSPAEPPNSGDKSEADQGVKRNGRAEGSAQQYRSIGKRMKNRVRDSGMAEDDKQACLDDLDLLVEKYRKVVEPKKPKKKSTTPYPQTVEAVLERFKGPEELIRPWSVRPSGPLPNGGLFYRTWDKSSQCQILEVNIGFLSGGADSNFDTAEGRAQNLKAHANWSNKGKTPFNSVTHSIIDIKHTWIFGFRFRQRPPIDSTRITIMNMCARVASRNPFFPIWQEIVHYKVNIPIKCSMDTYKNEWLCPFRIFIEEIVWSFHYADVQKWLADRKTDHIKVWEDEVARPAFEEHERLRKLGVSLEQQQFKLVTLMQKVMPEAVKTHWLASMQGCLLG